MIYLLIKDLFYLFICYYCYFGVFVSKITKLKCDYLESVLKRELTAERNA